MPTIQHNFDYASCYEQSLKINWKIEDIIGGDKTLDFSKPFLPDALADAEALDFLSASEKLAVNHIRANSYLYLFGFVEAFILPFVADQARSRVHNAKQQEIRALLHFAEEESKHIELFERFVEEFEAGFGSTCDMIGPPDAIAKEVLSKSELGVAILTLHIEWMTLLHYVESVRDNTALDPQFCSLLRNHWMEESQHAKLDTLLAEALVQDLDEQGIQTGFDDYLAVGGMLAEGLGQQVELDIAALTRATGRQLSDSEAERYREVQKQSYHKVFLTSGMRHPRFQEILNDIQPAGAQKVLEVANMLVPE
jgi:hypothetical protein